MLKGIVLYFMTFTVVIRMGCFMFFIGVNVSGNSFACCITNSSGDLVSTDEFCHSDDGFYSFIHYVGNNKLNNQGCLIGLEKPCSRLVNFLTARGYSVLLVSPEDLARYKESRFPSEDTSDQGNERLIADYIRQNQEAVETIEIPARELRERRLMLEDRDRLAREKVRLSSQLINVLKDYFPRALDAFDDITSKPALEFLRRFDTFEQAKYLFAQDTEQFLDQYCFCQERDRDRLRHAMDRDSHHTPSEVIRAKVRLKRILVGHLTLLNQEIEDYERQI